MTQQIHILIDRNNSHPSQHLGKVTLQVNSHHRLVLADVEALKWDMDSAADVRRYGRQMPLVLMVDRHVADWWQPVRREDYSAHSSTLVALQTPTRLPEPLRSLPASATTAAQVLPGKGWTLVQVRWWGSVPGQRLWGVEWMVEARTWDDGSEAARLPWGRQVDWWRTLMEHRRTATNQHTTATRNMSSHTTCSPMPAALEHFTVATIRQWQIW